MMIVAKKGITILTSPQFTNTKGSHQAFICGVPNTLTKSILFGIAFTLITVAATAQAFAAPGKYPEAQVKEAKNPIIFADVPDMSMVRVGDTYYMSSTTMHMSPGVPIMKSKDLVNWKLVS